MKKYLCLLVLALFALAAGAPAQTNDKIPPELEKELREMIRLTQADKLGLQMGEQMLNQLAEQADKPIPAEFRDRMLAKFSSDQLIELILPIYARHLALEDVRAMNAFYRSPAGQKVISVMPKIVGESMQAGSAWGQKVAGEVLAEMKANGYVRKDL